MSYHGNYATGGLGLNLMLSPTTPTLDAGSSGGAGFTKEALWWANLKVKAERLKPELVTIANTNRNLGPVEKRKLRDEIRRIGSIINKVGTPSGSWTGEQMQALKSAHDSGGMPSEAAMKLIEKSAATRAKRLAGEMRGAWSQLAASLAAQNWGQPAQVAPTLTMQAPMLLPTTSPEPPAPEAPPEPTPEEVAAAEDAARRMAEEEVAARAEAERRMREEAERRMREPTAPPRMPPEAPAVAEEERKFPWLWVGLGAVGVGVAGYFIFRD